MKVILLYSFIFLSNTLFCQFESCNSSTEQYLYDVWFVDENMGVAVGDRGTIIKSMDGGLNWEEVHYNDTIDFKKVKFFNDSIGLAVGTNLYITHDAGTTWTPTSNPNKAHYDIEILNETTCVISGWPHALIKSIDAGSTFFSHSEQPQGNIQIMDFVDENVGYASRFGQGNTSIYKSINGGLDWDKVSSGPEVFTIREAMSFISENRGFIGGWYIPSFLSTSDGSITWDSVNFLDPILRGGILDFHIETELETSFYACGTDGEIFKSIDQGINWNSLSSGVSSDIELMGIYFINDSIGWVVGSEGVILRTVNGGGVTVGLEETSTSRSFEFYPNPVQDIIHITEFNVLDIIDVEIFSLDGLKIYEQTSSLEINVAFLPKGIYVLKLRTTFGSFNKLFIKA